MLESRQTYINIILKKKTKINPDTRIVAYEPVDVAILAANEVLKDNLQ